MASAPNAGAVHPFTRKIAEVAISVAMVMPETGDADEPTMPTMRAETVTKRKPKTTISSAAARFASGPTYAPGTGLNCRKRNMRTISTALPPKTTLGGRSCSVREGRAAASFAPPFLRPWVSALTDRGQRADQGDEAGGRNRTRSHRANVRAPQIGGRHIFDQRCAWVERMSESRSEEIDGGHQDQPREDAAGKHDCRNPRADDVADAEVLGRAVGADAAAL